jgi:uncharacterized integral membrane protein
MRDKLQSDAGHQTVQASNSQRSSATLAAVRAYWKLALGVLLLALLALFAVQNADAINVKFFVWEADMPQALVVFLALLSGMILGVALNKWQRWRLSRRAER